MRVWENHTTEKKNRQQEKDDTAGGAQAAIHCCHRGLHLVQCGRAPGDRSADGQILLSRLKSGVETEKVESVQIKMKKKLWLLMIPAILAVCFLCNTGSYYRAENVNTNAVKTDCGWFFDGPSEESALIFYPGAKVEETAYAPLLQRIAESSMDVVLEKMPFHLAIFGMNAATDIMRQYDYENWYIGGHSLGGAMAAGYAADHDLTGVILLAAYPTKLVDEPMLLIYGSEDGVVNMDRIAGAEKYGVVEKKVITGGNHAGFGNYGVQKGDGTAAISTTEQQEITAQMIASWLDGLTAAKSEKSEERY